MENTLNQLDGILSKMYAPAIADMLKRDTIFDKMRKKEKETNEAFIQKHMTKFDKRLFGKFKSRKIKNAIMKKYFITREHEVGASELWQLFKRKRLIAQESIAFEPITIKVHYPR